MKSVRVGIPIDNLPSTLAFSTLDDGTVILHSCDILSWAPVPSNECRSTGLYGAIKADLE